MYKDALFELSDQKHKILELEDIKIKYTLLTGLNERQYREIVEDKKVDESLTVMLLVQRNMSLEEEARKNLKSSKSGSDQLDKARLSQEKAQDYAMELSIKVDELKKDNTKLKSKNDELFERYQDLSAKYRASIQNMQTFEQPISRNTSKNSDQIPCIPEKRIRQSETSLLEKRESPDTDTKLENQSHVFEAGELLPSHDILEKKLHVKSINLSVAESEYSDRLYGQPKS